MAGDMKAEAVERGARAIWTRYTTSKICKEDHRDIPWTTLVRWGEERPLIQDLVNTAREESAVALNEWVALLSERGWKIVPAVATEYQYEAMKVFVECCLSSVGKIDVGLTYGTGVAASPSPFPAEIADAG